jgi:hypothetical protein
MCIVGDIVASKGVVFIVFSKKILLGLAWPPPNALESDGPLSTIAL